ncbi:MAG: hypothetical protein DLM67_06765 [Candidatus Nephthysia bennettiae]|uniref:Lipoprotein n=1 Tax=Candidatus Nephthysia bennettiae TaxID=3127016 RepID=A0A934K8L0_9BACT|nr:hypothetical protein [Candidatus Dormibacteraeota bacterium]MBJ7611906.1 hypothetical protein [Candidatus Dormibacteraeota bacterium]PZR97922.1 MAG: hypothetical protein DLM67_06765 [Candidatus Dormibacteraeota bacterium]
MTQRPDVRLCLALVVGAVALAACAGATAPATPHSAADTTSSGDIPDTQAYVSFTPTAGGYSLKVPDGWTSTANGSAVTFTSHFNSIRVDTVAAPQALTTASVTASELPALRSGTPSFALRDVTSVHRSAGEAVRIRYTSQSQPDPVTGRTVRLDVERYEFWRGGVQATLTLADPAGADNTDP